MRLLGSIERCIWHGDKVSRLNFVTVVGIKGPLTADGLRAGLATLQARHPLLRARVETRWRRPRFAEASPAPPIPLETLDAPTDGWVEVAEARVRAWIDPAVAPLFRCAWLRHGGERSTVLLTFHHIIGDGISGAYVVRDLLEALARDAAPGPARGALALAGPIEAHTPRAVRRRGVLRQHVAQVWRMLRVIARNGRPVAPPLDAPRARISDRAVCIVPRTLGSLETGALARRARAEGTTMHGALATAILLTVAADHQRAVPMLLASPVNLRETMEPPVEEDVGLFVSMAATMHRVDPASAVFWELARATRAALVEFIDDDGPFTLLPGQSMALGALVPLLPAGLFARLARAIQLPGVGLTNIGRVSIASSYGPFAVTRMTFAASLGVLGELAVTAATLDGTLALTMLGMSPTIERTHTARLADAVIDRLRAEAAPDRPLAETPPGHVSNG